MTEQNNGNSMNKYQLKKLISELEDIRGRNTELVSLYIPADYDMSKISDFITSEQSEAENIKSKHTRTNVQDALGKIGRKVREEQETPENGVVFFSGNVSDTEGRPEIEIWEVVPPEPIESRRYRCDKEFVLEPLKQMIVDDRVYGLIVADKNEAAIGYLQGNSIKTAYTMESNVPGKTRAGGQCLDPDTMVQMSDGNLKRISEVQVGDSVKSVDLESMEIGDSEVLDKWREEKQVHMIETKFPEKKLIASEDHEVFTSELSKKSVEDLEVGESLIFPSELDNGSKDCLLAPERYCNSFLISEKGREKLREARKSYGFSQRELGEAVGATQTAISKIELGERAVKRELLEKICRELGLNFLEFAQYDCRSRKYRLPKKLDEELSRILGYFAGDGSFDPERLNFHEGDKELAEFYSNIIERKFDCDTSIKFREDKNYYRLRAFGKPLVEFVKNEFPEINDSRNTEIPAKILRSDEEILKSFIGGFYDAEGHCSESRSRVGISANNKTLMQQLQSALLQQGIISSLREYDNSENPYTDNKRYTVDITDAKSLQKFRQKIGFSSDRKKEELEKICDLEKDRCNNRQVLEGGEKVREIIEQKGSQISDYWEANTYLQGNRKISKTAFQRNILEESSGELREEMKDIHKNALLPTKIKSIEKLEEREVVDISVEAGNFIANNLVVHNSAQRFARLREEMLKTFLGDIAENAKKAFLDKAREDKLLGIIVGGPGFVKDKLVEDDYLQQELQEKVIDVKSLDTSGEAGFSLLVDKAEDAIEDSQAVKEKQLMKNFFDNLKQENGKSEYGLEPVMKAMEMGAVDTVLISEDFDHFEAIYRCPNDHEKEVFEEQPEIEESVECDECGEEMNLEEIQDIVDVMAEKAEDMGSELEIISTDHEEGQRLMNMGGIAALLRYRIR
ncbi:MAG: LAGLIDADG family homing endonuclease [Candidatus Nanohaloarchaea archaeon]